MKSLLINLLLALLVLAAAGLTFLANIGAIRFGRPFVYSIPSAGANDPSVVAFTNVNVLAMDRDVLLESQTVIITDGRISGIGKVDVPENAFVIDAAGKYLMPGLVDMHVHVEFENDLLLFVANGVTTVRNMWGNTGKKLDFGLADQLELRGRIESGELFGPKIYTAGPVMEGEPAFHPLAEVFVSPEEAAASVVRQKAQGYDFIKVYDNLSADAYAAVITEAGRQGMYLAGHVPFAVGLDNVLASGQRTIEHLAGYIESDEARFLISEDRLDEYARRTAEAGVWNCVTLIEYPTSKQTPEGLERLKSQPGMDYLSPGWRLMTPFMYTMAGRSHTYAGTDYAARMLTLNRRMVRELHAAGAGILLGTDAAQPYNIPGFSVHEELALLVEAGLSPFEALQAGTVNAAEALGHSGEFGVIAEGAHADLLLLNANPLEDIGNTRQISGVMLRGRWLAESELSDLMSGLRASFRPGFLERLWPLGLLIGALVGLYRRFEQHGKMPEGW